MATGNGEAALKTLDDAITAYDTAIDQNPTLTEAYNNKANALLTRARILMATGNGDEATGDYDAIINSSKEIISKLLALNAYEKVSGFYLLILKALLSKPDPDNQIFLKNICELLEFTKDDQTMIKSAFTLVEHNIFSKIRIDRFSDEIEFPVCRQRFTKLLGMMRQVEEYRREQKEKEAVDEND